MDGHAYDEEDEYGAVVGYDGGDLREVPVAANLCHHVGGCAPCHLVGFGGVEVGAGAEEEACEGDEDEGEEGVPDEECCVVGFALPAVVDEEDDIEEHYGYGCHVGYEGQHVEQGAGVGEARYEEDGCHGGGDDDAPKRRGAFLPVLIDEDAQSVEAAPRDEVEAGSMPEAAEEHGVHVVDVGGEVAACLGEEDVDGQQDGYYGGDDDGDPCSLGEECHDDEGAEEDGIGAEGAVAVAAEGYVEVVFEPVGERHVPAFPEACGVGGLVGRVEVGGQVEAHHHGYADGDVGVAREVGIDLQRIDHECGEVLEGGVEVGVLEHAVHEAHGEVVAQHELLEESVENPEYGDAELASAYEGGFVELWDELVGTDDGTRHELWEE